MARLGGAFLAGGERGRGREGARVFKHAGTVLGAECLGRVLNGKVAISDSPHRTAS